MITDPSSETLLSLRNSLTVNESEALTFACQSRGRPTPRLELRQNDVMVNSAAGGDVSLVTDKTVLNYVIASSQCSHAGRYVCEASNDLGTDRSRDANIIVNCESHCGFLLGVNCSMQRLFSGPLFS
jgi:hypothetical protein